MLEKGRHQIAVNLTLQHGKNTSRNLLRASDIKKNITGDYEHRTYKFQSAWEKSIPNLRAPKAKFSTLNCWSLAKFNSRKAKQYFSQE